MAMSGKERSAKYHAAHPERTRECVRRSAKKRWEQNPEQVREKTRKEAKKRREQNPEREREKARINQAKWRAANPEHYREYVRQWRAKNPEYEAEARKKWKEKNPERYKHLHLMKKHGISFETYQAMLEQQKGLCAACLEPFSEEDNPYVDHCHKTQVIRGLVHMMCNTGLGHAKDNPEKLRRWADYLERST